MLVSVIAIYQRQLCSCLLLITEAHDPAINLFNCCLCLNGCMGIVVMVLEGIVGVVSTLFGVGSGKGLHCCGVIFATNLCP